MSVLGEFWVRETRTKIKSVVVETMMSKIGNNNNGNAEFMTKV